MAIDDTIARLAQAPLIGLLDRDALGLIAASGDGRRLRPRDILFRAGERSDGGYVVLEGELAVAREGTDALVLAGPGALIGRLALFVRTPRPAAAIARVQSTVLRITPTLMRRVFDEHPEAALRLRDALSEDLEDLTEDLGSVRRKLSAIERRSS